MEQWHAYHADESAGSELGASVRLRFAVGDVPPPASAGLAGVTGPREQKADDAGDPADGPKNADGSYVHVTDAYNGCHELIDADGSTEGPHCDN
jgi:hypothetical protein